MVVGEAHLRRILAAYRAYYNRARTHLALGKDTPLGRSVQASGRIVPVPMLGGLHHQIHSDGINGRDRQKISYDEQRDPKRGKSSAENLKRV